MKVSIIIPVYNVAEYIERCLLSALNQTYSNIEILLIDDCGQDNSIEQAKVLVTKHPNGNRVRFLSHEKNRGLSAARNTGIEEAQGDYLYFLDSDDEITHSCIEKMLAKSNDQSVDFIIADYHVIGSQKPPHLLLEEGLINNNEAILNAYVSEEWYMMAWNKLVNRSFLINNCLFFEEGLIYEDNLWSLQLAYAANTMFVIRDKTYKYYIREGSIIRTGGAYRIEHHIKIIKLMNEYTKEKGYVNRGNVHNYLENYKFSTFFSYYKLMSLTEKKKYYMILKGLYIERRVNNRLFVRKIKDLHYKMPLCFGFAYYQFLVFLCAAKRAYYHRQSV